MTTTVQKYNLAGLLIALAGILQISTLLWQGWNDATKMLLIIGLVLIGIGLLVRGHRRWAAYFGYIFALIGAIYAFALFGSSGAKLFWGVVMVINLVAAYFLFRILWAPKKA